MVFKNALTSDTIQDCFGSRLRLARERAKQTQQWLAQRVHKSRVIIANYETGKAGPDPDVAVQLARILGEDPAEYLLLANLQRAFCLRGTADKDLLEVANQLLSKTKHFGLPPKHPHTLETHLSLLDFPDSFLPVTVVVGDKREDDPQNAGDLFAFSASTVDDRWLLSLGLPSDTEKISDKVVMTAEQDVNWIKKHFANRNILCIGSPASNLFARKYNSCFLFRFAISRETHAKWKKTLDEMSQLQTQAALLNFHEQHRADLKQKMRLFKSPGFVDFNYEHLRLGMDLSYGKDFAVVSLGRNFFADPDAPYFAILAAGVHHPGTAKAVKFLSEAPSFEKHPFGGILEVDVPSKKVDPRSVSWHNKIEESVAYWHTVEKGSLEYTPASLLKKLEKCMQDLRDGNIVTDVELDEQEIKEHIKLIEKLASAKRESVGLVENQRPRD